VRRDRSIALLFAGALLIACFELSAPPSGLSSISTLQVAWPSVVVDDSLRDADGIAVPLRVEAFDGDGNPVTDAEVTFIPLDTGLSVTPTGFVKGERLRVSPVNIVAQVRRGGEVIQTPEVRVDVVPRPDTVNPAGSHTMPTKTYTLSGLADTSWVRSDQLNVTVSNRSRLVSNQGSAAVRRWLVRYEITDDPPGADNAVTAFFALPGNPTVAVDTTEDTGVATLQVILRTRVLQTRVGNHQVRVTATVRERGQNVLGSPIQFVVPFEIRNPP